MKMFKTIIKLAVLSICAGGASFISTLAWAQTLTATTTATIVNNPRIIGRGANIAPWDGAWPTSIDARLDASGNPDPSGRDLYIFNQVLTGETTQWDKIPFRYPYSRVSSSNTINAIITHVYSPNDSGSFWEMISWDFLGWESGFKRLESGPDDCWQGTVVSTLADNGGVRENVQERFRSNVLFTLEEGFTESSCPTFNNQIRE